ncbi:diadenylate cyclase CdaA [Erysipelothrix tonsillarum]|uniref:diadenylate cyclase CdaA n=1 Tax=Erysipelothrix tonsillarum TaxID=38402 RepID=UPI0003796B54|nr:diadenylate cyclase CdaA [Erysipelothrix tonsillarum]
MPFALITFQSIINSLKAIVDFSIIWILVYYILRIVRNNSRTVQIFKGIVLIIAMRFVAHKLSLTTLKALLDLLIQYGFLVVVIIFVPEIRAMLERLGKTSVFSALHSLSGNEKEKLVDELVDAATVLAERKTGALITLEQGHSLADYIKTGTPINSSVTSELLCSIFVTSTPLHDGAVIIQGDRIACASAYFPPTAQDLPTRYGARHRAAIGLSEVTDSVTIVVSEETGTISIAEGGKLREMDAASLREYLNLLIQNSEKEVSQSLGAHRKQRKFNLSKLNVDPIKIEKVDSSDLNLKSTETADVKEEKRDFSKLMGIFKKKPKDTDADSSSVEETKTERNENQERSVAEEHVDSKADTEVVEADDTTSSNDVNDEGGEPNESKER